MYPEQIEIDFCECVAEVAEREYDIKNAANICFNLLETGAIPEDVSIEEAAYLLFFHVIDTAS